MENDPLISSENNQKRKPYHYTQLNDQNATIISPITSSSSSHNGPNYENDPFYWSERANYSRFMYYSRLRQIVVPENDDILLIPPHVIPNDFFYPQYDTHSSDGKQSSIITIFALWNTMMGTSLLSMPWALQRAGVIPGITLLCGMAGLSFYTTYRILQVFEAHQNSIVTDFAVLCKRLLGKWAQVVAVVFSALTLLGASIVYWVLMSNFLFHTVDYIHSSTSIYENSAANISVSVYCPSEDNSTNSSSTEDDQDAYHKIWNLHKTVPLFLALILGPLACIRSPTFFTKFNSLGTVSVLYLVVFILVKCADFGVNINFTDATNPSFAPLYKSSFPALSGMLSMAFFIHNCVITIMKNNRYQYNNKRDVGVAFIFVALTYFLVGGVFFVIFPLEKSCIQDNFLNNFRSFDLWAFTARLFLFFQMVTVFPLFMYIVRVQVCYSITKKEPTMFQTVFISTIVIGICICFAIWLPQIGNIIRFVGAIGGVVYLFFLPISLYLTWLRNINQLTFFTIAFHLALMCVGLANFVLQFIVD